jgi:hypothetical protein
MKIIALEIPGPRAGQRISERSLEAEARRVWELEQEGLIREMYFRADRNDAVMVLECPDPAAAELALATLPLVRENLIGFELVPLRAYPGFARLFSR